MKQITGEWVEKAEGDYAMMERESRVRKDPTTMVSASMRSSARRST